MEKLIKQLTESVVSNVKLRNKSAKLENLVMKLTGDKVLTESIVTGAVLIEGEYTVKSKLGSASDLIKEVTSLNAPDPDNEFKEDTANILKSVMSPELVKENKTNVNIILKNVATMVDSYLASMQNKIESGDYNESDQYMANFKYAMENDEDALNMAVSNVLSSVYTSLWKGTIDPTYIKSFDDFKGYVYVLTRNELADKVKEARQPVRSGSASHKGNAIADVLENKEKQNEVGQVVYPSRSRAKKAQRMYKLIKAYETKQEFIDFLLSAYDEEGELVNFDIFDNDPKHWEFVADRTGERETSTIKPWVKGTEHMVGADGRERPRVTYDNKTWVIADKYLAPEDNMTPPPENENWIEEDSGYWKDKIDDLDDETVELGQPVVTINSDDQEFVEIVDKLSEYKKLPKIPLLPKEENSEDVKKAIAVAYLVNMIENKQKDINTEILSIVGHPDPENAEPEYLKQAAEYQRAIKNYLVALEKTGLVSKTISEVMPSK